MSEREPCQQFVRQWPVGNGEWIDTTGKVCPRCGFMESAHRHTGEDYNEVATVNAEISRRNAEIHEKIERLKTEVILASHRHDMELTAVSEELQRVRAERDALREKYERLRIRSMTLKEVLAEMSDRFM